MRVSMLVRCLAMMRGGGETRHLEWARELTALGVDVEIITGVPLSTGRARYPINGFTVRTVRSPYARDLVYRWQNRRGFGRLTMTALHLDEEWFCRAAWQMAVSDGRPPDILHAHALHQAARLRIGNVPVVINLPGPPNPRYTSDLQAADALVADGWAATHMPAALGRAVDRVPKGVDSDRFQPDGPDQRHALRLQDRRVIVTVARLVPIKNLRLLIDAVALVRARVSNVHLLIVGSGPEADALKQHAAILDLADAVTWVGYVSHADTPPFYRTGNVFALSSDFDNSPNVVLEAMASGLPVVTTDVGGVREFVGDGAGGAVVPPRDAAALAAALERFLVSPVLARTAGAHNGKRARAEFSWRTSAQRLLDVYHRVSLARRGTALASA
jgi:glycosyltransferase involved in cell wall biosynthesis